MTSTKKLLIFIDWFYPAFKGGGPIQSCFNLAEALSPVLDVYIITGDRDLGDLKPFPDLQANRWLEQQQYKIFYMSPEQQRLSIIRQLIKDIAPDHIYLNSMYSRVFSLFPLLVNRMNGLPTGTKITVAPRGMLLDSAVSKKKWKKKFFLLLSRTLFTRPNIRFHATNNIEKASILSYFPGSDCFVANNLGRQKQASFRNKTKISGELDLIFVARIEPIKNLDLLLEALMHADGNIHFRIVGPVEDDQYWLLCQDKIAMLPGNIKVEHLGPVPTLMLEPMILDSHLFVLLSKGENFGHSIFEALLCGRPVLVSNQTPWKGLEALKVGFDIGLDDVPGITARINEAVSWDQQNFNTIAENAWSFASSYLASDNTRHHYIGMFS